MFIAVALFAHSQFLCRLSDFMFEVELLAGILFLELF